MIIENIHRIMTVNLQEDLTGFMAAASKFQIKGLSEEKVGESQA